jgi:hypothetical protein
MKNEWIKISDQTPPENKTVWLYNEKTNFVAIGLYTYVKNEGWFYAITDMTMYTIESEIIVECEIDDYEFTHWHEVPKLPTI